MSSASTEVGTLEDDDCSNQCCKRLRIKLDELKKKYEEDIRSIKDQLKKFDNPDAIAKAAKAGDFFLQSTWLKKEVGRY